jgi:hypothetical protein
VKEKRGPGAFAVTDTLDEPYPAPNALNCIRNGLPPDKWTPQTEDWMNPGQHISPAGEWQSFIDGSETPHKFDHSWIADWKNDAGDIVRYSFLYESHCTGSPCHTPDRLPDNSRLHISAIWVSAAQVEEGKRALEKHRRGHNP